MLAETFFIYSSLHTQIFLDCLYVVIGPSISTNKQIFVYIYITKAFKMRKQSLFRLSMPLKLVYTRIYRMC